MRIFRIPPRAGRSVDMGLYLECVIVGAIFDRAEECRGLMPQEFRQKLEWRRGLLWMHDSDWLVDHGRRQVACVRRAFER